MRLNSWFAFLLSALSGCLFLWLVDGEEFFVLKMIVSCIGLIPFLWMILQSRLRLRMSAYLGFTIPITLSVGEGMWFSMRYFYEIPFITSLILYVLWVCLLSGIHWLVFSAFCRRLIGNELRELWAVPFFWVSLEFLYGLVSIQCRSFLIGIFPPFSAIGSTLARVGGVYAVSFGIVWTNIFILALFLSKRNPKVIKSKGWIVSSAILMAVLGAGVLYAGKKEPFKKPVTLALLQPNQQFLLWGDAPMSQRRIASMLAMTQEALSRKVDIIVWPASSLVIRDNAQIEQMLKTLNATEEDKTKLIIGLERVVPKAEGEFFQNTVYLTDLKGNVAQVYVKQHLTPYTEYIPFPFLDLIGKRKLESLEYISSKDTDLVLKGENWKGSTAICLEIYYPELLRKFIRKGAQFLIHLSNEDVYGTSHFREFLLKITRFRALELGIPVFRLGIDGYSAFISHDGKILDSLPQDQKGILYAKLDYSINPSLYARIGDVFSWLCVIITLIPCVRLSSSQS